MNLQAESLGVYLKLKVVEEVNVSMDRLRTQQILINLIQNSLKFSSKSDTVTVMIEQKELLGNQTKVDVFITVTDQGMGIPPED